MSQRRLSVLRFDIALAAFVALAIPAAVPARAQKDAGQIDVMTIKEEAHRRAGPGLTMRVS